MRPRGIVPARSTTILLPALLAVLACSPDLRGTTADFQLLVFPGEAELGGSATAVISSNYVPYVPGLGGDAIEDYQLERSRVGIEIKDAGGVKWPATLRAVFPLAASATSRFALTHPGAWATVVLFDLPTAAAAPTFQFGAGPPFLADVIVSIDGVAVTNDPAVGSIRITGTGGPGIGGQPTTVLWPAITDLELDSVVTRFRPVLDQDPQPGGGFPLEAGGTVIAGIEADLVYFSPCFTDAEAYTGTEASDASIYLGPQKVVGGAGFIVYRRLVLTYPEGFTLLPPAGGTPGALGQGPLIDVAFDRPNQSIFDCEAFVPTPVWLWNVYAIRPDRSPLADQRGTGTLNESSDLFALYSIPAEP